MASQEDFEPGEEIVEVERRQRAGSVVSVRLTPDEIEGLGRLAERSGTTVSQVLRRVVDSFLRAESERRPALAPWTSTVTGVASKLEVSWNTVQGDSMYTSAAEIRDVEEHVPQPVVHVA